MPAGASSMPCSRSRSRSSRLRRPVPVWTAGSTWSLHPMRNRCFTRCRSLRVIWDAWTWSRDTGMVPTSYWVSTSFKSRANSSPSSSVSSRMAANWSITPHSSSQSWLYSLARWSCPSSSSRRVRSSSCRASSSSSKNAHRASSFPRAPFCSRRPAARRPRGPPTRRRRALIWISSSVCLGVKRSRQPAGLPVQSLSRIHMDPWMSQATT